MKQTDVTCPNCFAGYRRIQLDSMEGRPGEYGSRYAIKGGILVELEG